jgi:hypothetical protein
MRYTPKTIHEVRRCIAGFSGQTRVEVESGIPVKAKTVADLRALYPVGRREIGSSTFPSTATNNTAL